jgi:hypothetical protein
MLTTITNAHATHVTRVWRAKPQPRIGIARNQSMRMRVRPMIAGSLNVPLTSNIARKR